MGNFKNSIDVLGHDAVLDSLIDRSITEFKDEYLTKVGDFAFTSCTSLKTVDLASITEGIGNQAFMSCSNLDTLILRSEEVPIYTPNNRLDMVFGPSWLFDTKIANGTGYIYVPSALVTYYGNTNEVNSSWLRALEDYTVDGTTTGELDPEKI